jgi:anthranilate synthase component 1
MNVEVQNWVMTFGRGPVAHPLSPSKAKFIFFPYDIPPLDVFKNLYKHFENVYILESVTGMSKLAQFSFIGFDPEVVLTCKGSNLEIKSCIDGSVQREKTDDPLKSIRNLLKPRKENNPFRLTGGSVGYISYDAIRYWERIPKNAKDDLGFPDVEMGIYSDGIIYNHLENKAFYVYRKEDRLNEIKKILKEEYCFSELRFSKPHVNMDFNEFKNKMEKIKEYIYSGDAFQAVLSKRFEFGINGDLIGFYETLRRINPSPYMYFLKMGKKCVVGSSPEMLVRVDKGMVETFPIAGTRPKSINPRANEVMKKDLLADQKEIAEHIMLVDLARNDIGKITEFGCVKVPEFMAVHEFSHVMHIVSQVKGRLRKGFDAFDTFSSVFPAGTVTGAPKVRTMEIIDELEPTQRGPYAGAVGYFSYDGNADFAITIRTLCSNGQKAFIQVGAGIVADSEPKREWLETDYKAGALMKALESCGRGE